LESTGEITLKSTNRFTIATVENWDFYQCCDEDSNQQITNKQPTSNQQATNKQPHLKNVKNVKNVKNNNIFVAPTLDEVIEYCNQRGKGVDPHKWFDYYKSNGWKVGRNPMKDWKAAVRTWERSNGTTKSKFSGIGTSI
jgi:hypothetical protein